MTADTLGFRGQWVRRGLVHIPIIDDETEDTSTEDMLIGVLKTIAAPVQRITGVVCDCGCLLRTGELCPVCVFPWCDRDAVKWSWNVDTKTNRVC